MSFEQSIKAMFDKLPLSGDATSLIPAVNSMRAGLQSAMSVLDGERVEMASVRNLNIPGPAGDIAARAYTPYACGVAPGPAILYMHGGAFVVGDLESHDTLCRRLAAISRCRLVAVNYRRAPEHRFPAAVEDALAAYDWLAGAGAEEVGADPSHLAVAGDSAGGNLAATVALERRAGDAAVRRQLLIYPLLQMVETNAERLRFLEGHIFSQHVIERMHAAYLSGADDARHPWASPLLRDDLKGVAPAYIVTARLDPLNDEGRAYADKLAACGVQSTLRHHPTAVHGFFQMTGVSSDARKAVDEAAADIGRALGAPVADSA